MNQENLKGILYSIKFKAMAAAQESQDTKFWPQFRAIKEYASQAIGELNELSKDVEDN